MCNDTEHQTLAKLDWANSAPIYPQTGHHSRNMFSLGMFVMGPLLCDIILRENMINHLYKNLNYKNLSNSIYNIFILQAKWYPQTTDTNFAHKNFAQCNQPINQYSIQITTQVMYC